MGRMSFDDEVLPGRPSSDPDMEDPLDYILMKHGQHYRHMGFVAPEKDTLSSEAARRAIDDHVQQERLRAKIADIDMVLGQHDITVKAWLEIRKAQLTKQLKEYEVGND